MNLERLSHDHGDFYFSIYCASSTGEAGDGSPPGPRPPVMGLRDISYLLSIPAALLFILALVAWFRILRKPDHVPPTRKDVKRGGSAAMVVWAALALSLAAAVVAAVGRILG
jgi:hypothetical protein